MIRAFRARLRPGDVEVQRVSSRDSRGGRVNDEIESGKDHLGSRTWTWTWPRTLLQVVDSQRRRIQIIPVSNSFLPLQGRFRKKGLCCGFLDAGCWCLDWVGLFLAVGDV